MPMLDVFNSDAFSVVSLTDALQNLTFKPGRIGQMGLFQEQGVATTTIAIEQKGDVLQLVAPTPRGGPGVTVDKAKANMRALAIPHFEVDGGVYAEEVQGVRAFGTESSVDTVMAAVSRHMQSMNDSIEMTHEFCRLGAIKGVVAYPGSNTPDLNLFTEFDVSAISPIDFDLDDASPESGEVRKQCANVIRTIGGVLGGVPFSGAYALCSDSFFDALIAHPEVRDTYLATQAAAELRAGYVDAGMSWGTFPFGGIMWENYRGGTESGSFIADGDAQIFPTGVAGLFKTVYAPADYEETVNTIGQRVYMKQYPMENGKGRYLEVQSNALHYCTRPRTLIRATLT